MASNGNIRIGDHGNETSNHKVPSYQIDAANLSTWLTGWGDYKTALEAILIGTLQHERITIYDTVLDDVPASNPFAQRELKLLVRYRGTTSGDKHKLTIACPDLASLTFASGVDGVSDYLDLTATPLSTWKTAFEAIARNPDDESETVTVTSVQVVGRNT